jgi:uncharacterized membrane protein YqjE
MTREGESGVGLFEAMRKAAATALSIAQSRLELATLELSVTLRQVIAAALLGLAGAMLMVFGFVALSAAVVVLLWDYLGVGGLFLLGLLYFGVGVGLAIKVRNDLRAQAPLLQATNAELHRDATMLRGHSSHAAPVDHRPPAH